MIGASDEITIHMKTRQLILTFLILSYLSGAAEGQKIITNSEVTGRTYAGKNVKRVYIPPPGRFFLRGAMAGGDITVNYSSFPANARSAFDYAVSIVESVLPSNTRMTINARWENVTSEDVLGSSSVTAFIAGWSIDALDPLAYYPIGLAEKILGESLNSDLQADIQMTVNASINWYYGTDGQTPSTSYDMVTVVMHEIFHGLGFFDSMNIDETLGFYGIGALPVIFDKFVVNDAGQKLTDTLSFRNNSNDLYNQYTGGLLYFDAPVTRKYMNGRPRLYSPAIFDDGSSISHLDEISNADSPLMTPFIDLGEAVHNPGSLTMAMLADLGWVSTRIAHSPSGDTEEALSELPLEITVVSDTTYNRSRVGVVYSYDEFETRDTIYMSPVGTSDVFRSIINIPQYNTNLNYYFFVEDIFNRLFKSPSLNEAFIYASYVGTDTIDPLMAHMPVKYTLQTSDAIDFSVLAADNLGIKSVFLEYHVNDGPLQFKNMAAGTQDEFTTILRLRDLAASGGDSIFYRIHAVDSAIVANESILPRNDFFAISVERIETVVESYITDFSNSAPDYFNIGFSIVKPSGFTNFGLHTNHPYESPEVDNGVIEYTAMLRHPVKIDASGLLINFSEVVLIEPGEPGSLFGSEDFYDYVVVEASDNFGRTWVPLANGYDSRYLSTWENLYNNGITGNNSVSVGQSSLLREHTIYFRPDQQIATGDTVLIRFRLFSDPYAYGWGWVIENLSINALINPVEDAENESFVAYPNPGNGLIHLDGLDTGKPFRYSIFNSNGAALSVNKRSDGSGSINISEYPSGMYIIVLHLDGKNKVIRYSLIK